MEQPSERERERERVVDITSRTGGNKKFPVAVWKNLVLKELFVQ